ncbi:MAG: ABC transporter ATP-binding protein [Thermodesulfobacteriota bacterium]|nr:ABC transporter ATP-binding protein [Thermodesulfobacteriota bacterium]
MQKKIKDMDFRLMVRLWPFIRPYTGILVFSLLLVFLVAGLDLIIPFMTKKAIDEFIMQKAGSQSFIFFGAIFFVVIALSFIMDFVQALFMEYSGQKIVLGLRLGLFFHMTNLPVSYFDAHSSGRLVSRVTNDIENMNEMFTGILLFLFKDIVLMTGIMAAMLLMDVKLALAVFCVVPLVFAGITFFSALSRKAFRIIRKKVAEINHSFSESISGIKIIQTTDGFNVFLKKFKKINFEHYQAGMTQIRVFALFMPLIGFLSTLCVGIIIYYGSLRILRLEISLGIVVAFISYTKMFFRPVRELSEKFNLLQSSLASAERIVKVLDLDQVTDSANDNREKLESMESLEFKNIFFSYNDDEPVLKDISFSIAKGESIGIVGHTGSGKSSVINLVSGFYKQNSGKILINATEYEKFTLGDIRSRTALVMQEPMLFSGSIRENIMLPGANIEDIVFEKALVQANCSFLWDRYKTGLDTMIHEGGRPLSSGEKQLVCIARAFAFNPDLIIFDEATSYMDSQSEQLVHEAMKKLMKNRISIIIAHRLSTVKECDRIMLFKNGEITESGTNEELLVLKGDYFNLVEKEKIGLTV